MKGRALRTRLVALLVLIAVVIAMVAGCKKTIEGQAVREKEIFTDRLAVANRSDLNGSSRFTGPTIQPTATPVVVVDCYGVSNCVEVRKAATPVWYVDSAGGVTQSGSNTYSGGQSFNSWVKVAATPAATATPQMLIQDVGAGVPLEIRNASATPEVVVNGSYELDMGANYIQNIGNAGTDFGSDGSLTTAAGITVTAGGLVISSGNLDVVGSITLANDETIVNSTDGIITLTVPASGRVWVATGNLAVGNGSPSLTLNGEDLYVEGTLEADGPARFDSGVTVGVGDVTISNGLILPGFTDLVVSDGETITPTVQVYALDTSGNVTITLAASGTEGQVLILIGDDANTITIADTNIRSSDGNAVTLGQYDVAVFVYQDSEWLLVSKSANS